MDIDVEYGLARVVLRGSDRQIQESSLAEVVAAACRAGRLDPEAIARHLRTRE